MPNPVYTFANREVLTSSKLNTNFQVLTQCVAKGGDTLTGTLETQTLRPATTLTYDLGSSSLLYNEAFLKTLKLSDSNDSHTLAISVGSNITANRTLSLVTGDSNRTLTLSGNPTLADWFDQSVKVASSPTFVAATLSSGPLTVNGVAVVGTDGKIPAISTTYFTSTAASASDLTTGTVPALRMGSGSPSATTVLYGDNTWGPLTNTDIFVGGGNGNSTSGVPVDLETVTIANFTQQDAIKVRAVIVPVAGQVVAAPSLYHTTDGVTIALSPTACRESAGNVFEWLIQCSTQDVRNLVTRQITFNDVTNVGTTTQQNATVSTAYTASWSLSLRSGGVSGGSMKWAWAVSKSIGQ